MAGIVDIPGGDVHRRDPDAERISFVGAIAKVGGSMLLVADLEEVCAGVESHLPGAG